MRKRHYQWVIIIVFIAIGAYFLLYQREEIPSSMRIQKAEENRVVPYKLYEKAEERTVGESLQMLQEDEAFIISNFNAIDDESLEQIRRFGIIYPERYEKEIGEELIIYNKSGMFHSGIIEKTLNAEVRKQRIDQFIAEISEFMEKTGYIFTLKNDAETLGTYTVMEEIYDHYNEKGEGEKKVGSYCSTYVVQKLSDEDQNYNYYTVAAFEGVIPYIGNIYLTNYFATGVASSQENTMLIDAKPHINQKLEKDQSYLIPASSLLNVGFVWTGRSGTEVFANTHDNMYTISFRDKKGFYSIDGRINFNFHVFFKTTNNSEFRFLYNHHLCNATYKRGRDPHYYGGTWHTLIVPIEEN